jgi:hypothetical protein
MTGCSSSDVKSTRASLARLANDVSETVVRRPFFIVDEIETARESVLGAKGP